jgi:hypothetical protein
VSQQKGPKNLIKVTAKGAEALASDLGLSSTMFAFFDTNGEQAQWSEGNSRCSTTKAQSSKARKE